VASAGDQEGSQGADGIEPDRLVEVRLETERQVRPRLAPFAVAGPRSHAEAVVAWRQMGVVSGTARAGLHPVVVQTIETVAESHFLRSAERQRRVVDLAAGRADRDAHGRTGCRPIEAPAAGDEVLYHDGHRVRAPAKPRRIHHDNAVRRWEPQPAVAPLPSRRLRSTIALVRADPVGTIIERAVDGARAPCGERRQVVTRYTKDSVVGAHP